MTMPQNDTTMHLERQRFKLRVWIRSRLWAQVVAGMLLGFGLGLLLSDATGLVEPQTAEMISLWLALPGKIFLGLIAMVLVPLIFSSIVGSMNGAGSGAELRAVGLRLGAFILMTTGVAAVIGVFLAQWLQPGAALRVPETPTPASGNDQLPQVEAAAPMEMLRA